MKIYLVVMSVCLASVLPAAEPHDRFVPNAVSPRKIVIGKKPLITLCKNGKSDFEVVKPANPAAGPAVKELIERLAQITGKKIVPAAKASGKVPAFYLGTCPEAEKLGLNPDKLDLDGYYIKTDGNRIFIVGGNRRNRQGIAQATLFGVYDFLERFAGVRYYFPGEIGTIVPKKKNWTLPMIDITERPDTQFRWIYYSHVSPLGGNSSDSGKIGDYQLYYRDSTLKNIAANHGLNSLELECRFSKTHPEFFAMDKTGKRLMGSGNAAGSRRHGQLCFSSQGLKEEIYQDAAACLTGKTASSRGIKRWVSSWNTQSVDLMPNDGMQWCQCPECKKVQLRGKQAMSDHIWKFTCDIAERLKRNGIKGYVKQNVYTNADMIPSFPIPDNVLIGVCTLGPWAMSNEKLRESGTKLIRNWSDVAHAKIRIWTYPTKAAAAVPVVPNFTPRAVAAFYKSQKDRIFGSFFEAGSDRWIYGVMNCYVFSRVMWNWDTDVEKLLGEHCRLMYGKAAPQMNQFYRELENLWMDHVVRNVVRTSFGDEWKIPTRREIWTKIYSPEKIAEINALLDQAEKAVAKSPQCLKRVKFMRNELWQTVIDGQKAFQAETSNRAAWTMYAGEADKITLDGKLNEEAWKKAEEVWLLSNPTTKKAEVQTRVKMLQDAENFYFGFEADEPETMKMVAQTNRKADDSEVWRDNGAEIFLSADAGSDFIYQFMFNSAGSKADLKNTNHTVDPAYNSGFKVKTATVPGKRWTAELRIPRSAMPELNGRTALVGNFTRHRVLDGEKAGTEFYAWFPKTRNIAENCGSIRLKTAEKTANLVRIPDFNQPLTANRLHIGNYIWSASGGSKYIAQDKEVFVTKGVSLRLEPGSFMVRQNIPVEPDKQYRLSFFVRTENLAPGLRILIRTGTTFYVLGNFRDYIRGTVNWYRVEKIFRTPKQFGKDFRPFLEFNIGKSIGKCWIDHVELYEVK